MELSPITPLLSSPGPLGFRRDGRPIWPIAGGSQDHPAPPAATPVPVPAVEDTPVISMTQEQFSRRCTSEKDQGRRAGVRDLLVQLGFDTVTSLQEALQTKTSPPAPAAGPQLTDLERREREAGQREASLVQREAALAERERQVARRAVLADLGAAGDDLDDAAVLLDGAVGPEADEEAVARAADEIKRRRPGFFAQPSTPPPAPAGGPAGAVPPRPAGPAETPGAGGLAMARRRGHLPASTS
ncbi:hypothetical protein [Streptomyces hainanensis]|uniref:Uncharacterized protein n=1 Tax=Streptomyces hainanensis TaxID=402648 RepID=A0A4R4TIR4_9ACTN|nr:hypothetical protein [Streptomyces hainanensis]TDC77510.1 hypothetical protein E1283_07170 [Streptomyces hainanensis]